LWSRSQEEKAVELLCGDDLLSSGAAVVETTGRPDTEITVEVHGRSFNRWAAAAMLHGRDLVEVLIRPPAQAALRANGPDHGPRR
jgi:hypothetical protein